ncbi:MAG TPA: hypothetical protein VF980_13675 [Thermoanaerobaculia bacterium]
MIFALLLLLLPKAAPVYEPAIQPAAPTVGDLITIEFPPQPPGPVVLDPSHSYEVVSSNGRRVVVRTFEPKPFTISGTLGGERFPELTVRVHSVLKPKDKLDPAPLQPPHPVPFTHAPFIAIGIAAILAAALWAAVVLLARAQSAERGAQEMELAPAERFRVTIERLRAHPDQPKRWAALADATRLYLASLSPHLGTELTTSQLLPRVDDRHFPAVAQILRQGDLEKFSPWGAPPADFDALSEGALALIPPPQVEEEQAAA